MPVYLCGAKDDSVIVLSSTGSFLLLSAETDGHRTEAIIHAKEILMFCDDNKEKNKKNEGAPLGQKNNNKALLRLN